MCVCAQGCASWKWYFPFHYAPFASDFKDIKGMFSEFEKGTKPVRSSSASLNPPPSLPYPLSSCPPPLPPFRPSPSPLLCFQLVISNSSCLQFKPLEQLMGVFPAASGNFLPETWRSLMSSEVSLNTFMTSNLKVAPLPLTSTSCLLPHRTRPSSTSTLTTLPSTSTGRSTPGRVSGSSHSGRC